MKSVTIRAEGCGGDNFTVLKNGLLKVGRELPSGEDAAVEIDAEAFPFPEAVLQGLARGAGLTVEEVRRSNLNRVVVVRRA